MAPFGVPAYLVLPYEDVREVLSDPTRFSSAFRTGGTPGGATRVSAEERRRQEGPTHSDADATDLSDGSEEPRRSCTG